MMKAYIFDAEESWSPFGSFLIVANAAEEATEKYLSLLSGHAKESIGKYGYSVFECNLEGLVVEANGYDHVSLMVVEEQCHTE